MRIGAMRILISVAVAMAASLLWAAPADVVFSASLRSGDVPNASPSGGVLPSPVAATVEAYQFHEVTAHVASPDAQNPFTDAMFSGWFEKTGTSQRTAVEGFCDSADGSKFAIRFMPSSPGDYTFSATYRQGQFEKSMTGAFRAVDGHRRGPVRVDPKYPWHFIWEGTGEHYFFNGTTAFFLAGWREERIIQYSIERLKQLKVNRIRVLLAGSMKDVIGEPVLAGGNFSMTLRPWVAASPQSYERPGIDYTRFNVGYWQRWEKMLRMARDRDIVISVILFISTDGDPARKQMAGSEEERRYIRYAAARLSAYSNVNWDLGDDLDSFRNEKWAHETGTLLMQWDPYKHLATSHPTNRAHQDRASDWFGFTSIQNWTRKLHELMLEERQIQLKTGRIIPQANEEYGYEDHYPRWAPAPPGDSAEVLRRCAWEIAMAGAYGTAGEPRASGTGIWPDTGGGWLNGRGDDTMVMLKGYAHMVDFFTSFDWWKTDPHDELVTGGAYCLAKPGEVYAVYLPLRPLAGVSESLEFKARLPRRDDSTRAWPVRCDMVRADDGREDPGRLGAGTAMEAAQAARLA